MAIHLALYQPQIPHNTGALIRLSACFTVPLIIIGPTGFDFEDRKLRRAGLDYHDLALVSILPDWEAFSSQQTAEGRRIILATTKAKQSTYGFDYGPNDTLLFGSETSGVPEHVHTAADHRLRIPMHPNSRSLNLALSAGMVTAEALRVTDSFPTQD